MGIRTENAVHIKVFPGFLAKRDGALKAKGRAPLRRLSGRNQYLFGGIENIAYYIDTFFYADGAAVQRKIVILRHAPFSSGIMLVIYPALGVFIIQPFLGARFRFSIHPHYPFRPLLFICMDENVQAIFSFP